MTVATTVRGLWARAQARLGRAPSCAWVQERLGAYYDWDLPSGALRAVEDHLQHCSDCARAWAAAEQVRSSVTEETLLAHGMLRASRERAAAVMGRIRVHEVGHVAAHGIPGPVLSRRRICWLAGASLAAAALPVVGKQVLRALLGSGQRSVGPDARHGVGPQLAPGTAPASDATMDPRDNIVAMPSSPTRSLEPGLPGGLGQQLDMAIVKVEIEAILPHTDEELEAWARREYPHIMWLYDVLKTECAYEGTWRDLLIGSGEIFRFDYPIRPGDPSCRPRIQSIVAAARAAGSRVIVSADGDLALPPLAWVDGADLHEAGKLRLVKVVGKSVGPIAKDRVPRGYVATIVEYPRVVESVLVYLIVSARVSDARNSTP